MTGSRDERRAWWASLTPAEQQAYIERRQAARAAEPSAEAREAEARLDLATQRGCFMRDIPDRDVTALLTARGNGYGSAAAQRGRRAS
jgi:hypothetical protein